MGVASPTAREPLLPMPRRAHHSHDDVVGVLTDVPEEACLPQAEIDRAAVVSKVRATVVQRSLHGRT